MSNVRIIIESNLPLDFSWQTTPCSDVSHSEPTYSCSESDRFLIFDPATGSGFFVHAGCASIKLDRQSSPRNRMPNLVLNSQPSGLFRRYKYHEDGISRLTETTAEEAAEYRYIEKRLARAVSGRVDRAPPPATKPQSGTPASATQATTDSQLSDVHMMDNFLSGPTPPPLRQPNLKRVQAAREAREKLDKTSALRKQKIENKPRTNPYDLPTSQKAASNLASKSAPLKLKTDTGVPGGDNDIIKTTNLPSNLTRIDITDKPELEKSLMDVLHCSDLSHAHDLSAGACTHKNYCVIVDMFKGYATLIHKDSAVMRKGFEEQLTPKYVLELCKAVHLDQELEASNALIGQKDAGVKQATEKFSKLGITGQGDGQPNAAKKTSDDKPKASDPIDIKEDAERAAWSVARLREIRAKLESGEDDEDFSPSAMASFASAQNAHASRPTTTTSSPPHVQEKSSSQMLREKAKQLIEEAFDPFTSKASEVPGAYIAVAEEVKGEGEGKAESKQADGVKPKIPEMVESKLRVEKSVSTTQPPRNVWQERIQGVRLAAAKKAAASSKSASTETGGKPTQPTLKQLPDSRIPKSKAGAPKQVEVTGTAVPNVEQKVEDEDWEAVDMDEAVESEYAFI